MAQTAVTQLMERKVTEWTEEEERRRSGVLGLRAERAELDQLHPATCTAGCRELRVECEWPSDDEQAEADCLLVINQEMAEK